MLVVSTDGSAVSPETYIICSRTQVSLAWKRWRDSPPGMGMGGVGDISWRRRTRSATVRRLAWLVLCWDRPLGRGCPEG